MVRDRPDMVLGGEDTYRMDRILITRWKTKDEQKRSWARQGEETR